jgi:cold shock protein
MKGKIKYFDNRKQYGFIAQDTGPDLFFGRHSLPYSATIDRGTPVEYEVTVDRQNRPMAKTVRPVNE